MPVMERPNLADLETLVRLAADGQPQVGRHAQSDAPRRCRSLQREMAEGHNRGKIVVRFAPEP